jgi:hypothetical protein
MQRNQNQLGFDVSNLQGNLLTYAASRKVAGSSPDEVDFLN